MIILVAVFVNEKEPEDSSIIGTVYDIKKTQNGYTFSFDDSSGGKTRCFSRTEPVQSAVYSVKGTMSDDGNILFVSSMQFIS
jgi:hypothetical protein